MLSLMNLESIPLYEYESACYRMPSDEQRLIELLIETDAFKYSPDKPFRLSSGGQSDFYLDLRLLNGHPEGVHNVALVLYNRIRQLGAKSVGGLEAGSIPISTAISQISWLEHQKDPSNPLIDSFYVRKKLKEHGTQKMIEGRISSPVIIVDDVITSGKSAIVAVDAVCAAGYDCVGLLSIVFRGTLKDRMKIESHGRFEYVFSASDIVERLKSSDAGLVDVQTHS